MHAGIHPGFKTQHRGYQKSELRVSVAPKMDSCHPGYFRKKIKQEGLIVEGQLSTFKPVTGSN